MFLKIKHTQDADSDLLNAWQTFAQIYINVRPKEGETGGRDPTTRPRP